MHPSRDCNRKQPEQAILGGLSHRDRGKSIAAC
jgi:hypothetical protein